MLRVKMFSRKSGLAPGFTTILKCSVPLNAMALWRAHRWKGAAGGNLFRIDLRRQMKCNVPTPRETLHPQHLQAQEFRRQGGQTHGLQATMHIWQSCEQQPAQLQNLPRLLSATSMMQ